LLLIGLMVGLVFAGAVSQPGLATSTTAQNTNNNGNRAYTAFWGILYNESVLVNQLVKENRSGSVSLSTVNALVVTSWKGEDNAANVSAQVWKALQQLRKAGVKLYYSQEELREMAENVSRNGLPQKTVQELKAQGWTDDEINALQEYIVKNADKIKGGFNMSSFFANFSLAFVRVGMTYASYETLALEVWGWGNGSTKYEDEKNALNDFQGASTESCPNVSAEWTTFKVAYSSDYVEGMLEAVRNISMEIRGMMDKANKFVEGGGLVFGSSSNEYYWPDALKAYNLSRRIYAIVKAMRLGSNDTGLRWMLNQEMAEFGDSLKVYHKGSSPQPAPPIPCFHGVCPTVYGLGTSQVSYSGSRVGYLVLDGVKVVVDSVNSTGATYHIVVSFHAVNNVVSNVSIRVSDLNGRSAGRVSFVHPDDGVETWKSKEFSVSFNGASEVRVFGEVTLTYTSMATSTASLPTPTAVLKSESLSTSSGSSSSSGLRRMMLSKSYVASIRFEDSGLNPNGVSFAVVPSSTRVRSGDVVSFKVVVSNENPVAVSGRWVVYVTVPDGNGVGHVVTLRGNVTVPDFGTESVSIGNFTYGHTGTFNYSGTFSFRSGGSGSNEYFLEDSGSVMVGEYVSTSDTVAIESVSVNPEYPIKGNYTTFHVKLKKIKGSASAVPVALYVNGLLVREEDVTFNGDTADVDLYWSSDTIGWYNYTIVANWQVSKSGILYVRGPNQEFAIKLEAFPKELNGGGTVFFVAKVWNFENSAEPLSGFVEDEKGVVVKKIGGFESRVPANAKGYAVVGFNLVVYGVGKHVYKLFLDDTDGKPNGDGEEHWSSVTVTVNPTNGTLKQVGDECSDLYFTWEFIDYHATLTCRAVLYNPTNESLTILNSSKGKPWIGISDSGVSMTPSSFNEHLSKFVTDVSNSKIPPQGNTVITFKSEISGVPLLALEYYWGAYYTITIPYDVHLSNGETLSFTLKGSGQITQNSYEVAADIGINVFLFKGAGGALKAVLVAKDLSKAGEAIRGLIGVLKEAFGWYKWWHH